MNRPLTASDIAPLLYVRWEHLGDLLDRATAAMLAIQRRLCRHGLDPDQRRRLNLRLRDLMARHERIAAGVDRARERWIESKRRT